MTIPSLLAMLPLALHCDSVNTSPRPKRVVPRVLGRRYFALLGMSRPAESINLTLAAPPAIPSGSGRGWRRVWCGVVTEAPMADARVKAVIDEVQTRYLQHRPRRA